MAGNQSMLSMLERWIAPLKRRVYSMVGKCIIKAIDDSGNLQVEQILFLTDELISGIERVQEFGFTSVPPSGSEGIVAFIGGNQQHGVVIATDSSKFRIKGLPEGAVAVYNKNGDYVKLTDDTIEVFADNVKLGKSGFKKLINEEFQSMFNGHVHHYFDSIGAGAVLSPKLTSKPGAGLATGPLSVGGAAGVPTGIPTYVIGNNEMTDKTTAE